MMFLSTISTQNTTIDNDEMLSLATYVAKQLDANFPSNGIDSDIHKIHPLLPRTIERLKVVLQAVHCFDDNSFNLYNSLQYTTFLYILANQQWKSGTDLSLAERLFYLNRALNSIDLFYSIEMPEVFFISHGLGSVLGNAKYGNRLVVFQNVTVGRVGKFKPVIGNDVILYPGTIITGKTIIGNNSVVSAGVNLHNIVVPDSTVVKLENGKLFFRENKYNYIDLYLKQTSMTDNKDVNRVVCAS